MKRVVLYIVFFVFGISNVFAQKPALKIRFDGRDKPELYKDHHIMVDNNEMILDYTHLSRARHPLAIKLNEDLAPRSSFSVFVWVKASKDRMQDAVILTNRSTDRSDGWEIRSTDVGSWELNVYLNKQFYGRYNPTHRVQPINDGEFHQIGFSYDFIKNQVWMFYDGENVGIANLGAGNMSGFDKFFIAGIGKGERYSFDGSYKSFHFYNQTMNRSEVLGLYHNRKSGAFGVNGTFYEKVKVLTWNIDEGGRTTGERIGLDRTLKVIRDSDADIIALQEADGSGEYLADLLGYHLYIVSRNLAILSKFPFEKTVKIYRAPKSGGVQVAISRNQYLYFFNVGLENIPDWSSFDNDHGDEYYREKEMRYRGVDIEEILNQLDLTLRPKENTPIVLVGHFNTLSPDGSEGNKEFYPLYNQILEHGYTDTFRELYPNPRVYPGFTVPDFDHHKRGRVDYIFFKGNKLQISDSKVIDHHPVKFPSNYYGVLTEFTWKK